MNVIRIATRLAVASATAACAARLLWWITAEPTRRAWSALWGTAPATGWTLESATTSALACAALASCAAVLFLVGLTILRELAVAAAPALAGCLPVVGPLRWQWWIASALGLSLVVPVVGTPATAAGDPTGNVCAADACARPLAGLPLPDLPLTRRGRSTAPPDTTVVVRAGDSLWSISSAIVPGREGNSAIASMVADIYTANRHTIGHDPDLIRPGTILTLPGGTHDHRQ